MLETEGYKILTLSPVTFLENVQFTSISSCTQLLSYQSDLFHYIPYLGKSSEHPCSWEFSNR